MAGLAMGLAVLSKSPALFLFPFAGLLALLIALTENYRPQAIVIWSEGRFTKRLPAYVEWVEQNYCLATSFGPKRRIYVPVAERVSEKSV